jgi:superfamily I DNA/RNA helicase
MLDLGIDAKNIVGVTFTNKAAEEMRERLRGMVGCDASQQVTLSTFHSLGLLMLKVEASRGNRRSRFTIFDTGDQLAVLRELLGRLKMGRAYDLGSILERISAYKNAFITPEQLQIDPDDPYQEVAALLYPRYEEQLDAYAAVDFDDLICRPCRMLEEDADCRERWRSRFRYVLVDEYQDTNAAQLRFLRALVDGHRNICVVGDDDQAIYGWRGADVKNILRFARDFEGAKTVYLMRNYRSVPPVLELANVVIAQNPHRHEKRLIPTRQSDRRVRLVIAPNGDAEAAWVAQRARTAIKEEGLRARDVAVLYRSNILARGLEGELREHGINYRVLGGQAFYERKEVKDLLAYLRVMDNPADEISLRRVINTPPRGIGPKTIAKLASWAEEHNVSLYRAAEAAPSALSDDLRAANAVAAFTKTVETLRPSFKQRDRLVSGLRDLIDEIALEDELRRSASSNKAFERRWQNVLAFCVGLDSYLTRRPSAQLSDYLSRCALSSTDDEADKPADAVTLSTLHGAKGLEFRLVFLIGVEEGFLPHDRTVNPHERDLVSGDLAEERRLFYVGITRARDELILSRTRERLMRGKPAPRTPSRFLDGVDESTIDIEDMSEAPAPERVQSMLASLKEMLSSDLG